MSQPMDPTLDRPVAPPDELRIDADPMKAGPHEPILVPEEPPIGPEYDEVPQRPANLWNIVAAIIFLAGVIALLDWLWTFGFGHALK